MKAAVYHGRRDIRIEQIADPTPGHGELLVQITAVGICGTDASEFANGPKMFPIDHRHDVTGHQGPMVPGHEFAGIVAGVGAGVTGFGDGDLITSGAGVSCGACSACLNRRTNLCQRYSTVGLERNGALAEFTTVPAAACLNVQDRAVTSDIAALAQPLSVAIHAMRRARPRGDEHTVVIGSGGIGSFVVHAASRAGLRVTAVDVSGERLRTAGALGAQETVLAARDTPLSEQLADLDLHPEIVYECSGITQAADAAISTVQRGGRVVMVGLQKHPAPIDLLSLTLQEKEVIGTLAHVFGEDFAEAVNLLEGRDRLWAKLAPTVMPLENLVVDGIEPMLTGGPTPIKTLLDPRTETSRPLLTSSEHDP